MFIFHETGLLKKAGDLHSFVSTTSATLRMRWIPWTDVYWTEERSDVKWHGMEDQLSPTDDQTNKGEVGAMEVEEEEGPDQTHPDHQEEVEDQGAGPIAVHKVGHKADLAVVVMSDRHLGADLDPMSKMELMPQIDFTSCSREAH